MPTPDPRPSPGRPPAADRARISPWDAAVFAAELAVYAAAGALGWRAHPLLGVAAVLGLALWWGLLHSPKARVRLPRPLDLGLRAGWFALGAAAAIALALALAR